MCVKGYSGSADEMGGFADAKGNSKITNGMGGLCGCARKEQVYRRDGKHVGCRR